MDEVVLYILRDLFLGALHLLHREGDTVVHALVLLEVQILVTIDEILQVLITLFGDSDHRRRLTRDGVSQRTALDASQTGFEVRYGVLQEAEEELDSVRTLQMDVASRVTTLAAFHRHLQRDVAFLRLYLLVAEGGVGVDTAGATDV